jgi:UDP-N-acetylmuramoylalanine--D-glutamate ligase
VGGNLGTPVLDFPIQEDGTYVLEMSSYQLEASVMTQFDVGILLNITADHLDRHGGMPGYVAAKQLIFKGMSKQGIGILGIDEEQTHEMYQHLSPYMNERLIPISVSQEKEHGYLLKGTQIFQKSECIFDMNTHPTLKGPHNAQNIMAVWAALKALGFENERIAHTIVGFKGLVHRQEWVLKTKEGLVFINDSKATNADATIQALKAYQDVHIILGGRPKEGGINSLIPYFDRIRHAFLIGEAAQDFAKLLNEHHVSFSITHTLEETLKADFPSSGIVLFSPACASFDQFNNFEERGDTFKKLVFENYD